MRSFVYSLICVAFFANVSNTSNNVESWTGKWFPEEPQEVKSANKDLDELFATNKTDANDKILTKDRNNTDRWNGNWFPQTPIGNKQFEDNHRNGTKIWSGKWFPQSLSNGLVNNTTPDDNSHKGQNKTRTKTWNGSWFPQKPFDPLINKTTTTDNSDKISDKAKDTDDWKGKWFPKNPSNPPESNSPEETTEGFFNRPWDGTWFPSSPSSELLNLNLMSSSSQCDNGKDNIDIDFDPENKRHAHKYLCLDFKAKYEPSYSIYPIQRKFTIPPAYEAPSYCLNETITYEERLPTFGAHRYICPKYGEYKYLPIQRWLHSLEKGAIVMLYHPCANQMQVETLRKAVRGCLYRHVISPSILLLPERPLALIAWGTSLEMSVVHLPAVVQFIKENAKRGPRTTNDDNNSYQADFIIEAKLVTDESDSELCPNFNP